jgi:hypothetical protein
LNFFQFFDKNMSMEKVHLTSNVLFNIHSEYITLSFQNQFITLIISLIDNIIFFHCSCENNLKLKHAEIFIFLIISIHV